MLLGFTLLIYDTVCAILVSCRKELEIPTIARFTARGGGGVCCVWLRRGARAHTETRAKKEKQKNEEVHQNEVEVRR